jgi:hypothetical protein
MFNNIRHLDLEYAEFDKIDLKILCYLPKLKFIAIKKLTYLNSFSDLSSLRDIWVQELDNMNNIEEAYDPTKIIYLKV